jgi:hypothetical protein
MSTFADYDEEMQRRREIHVAALEARKLKARTYSPEQLLVEDILEARSRDGHRGEVYFLRESGSGAIKIGTSTNVALRVRNIRRDMPHEVVLLATIRGGYQVEAQLLAFFEHARIRGEWFRPVPELLEYIEGLPK